MAAITGKVTKSPSSPRVSKAGNEYSIMGIYTDGGDNYKVFSFHQQAHSVYERVCQGDEVLVVGNVKEDSTGVKSILANQVTTLGAETAKMAKQTQELLDKEKEPLEREQPQTEAKYKVKVMGRWRPAMDILVAFYGPELISENLRRHDIYFTVAGFPYQQYEAFLQKGFIKLQEKTGLVIEEFNWTD